MIVKILGSIFGPLLKMLGVYAVGRNAGKNAQIRKQHEQDNEARARGREAVQRGRDSGKSAAERMRDNDDKWGGV